MKTNGDNNHQTENYDQLINENTQLKAELKNLKSQNKVYQQIVNSHLSFMQNLHIIAYSADLQWHPHYCMGAIKEISGFEEKDFIDQNIKWEQLIHPEDMAEFRANRQNFLQQKLATLKQEYRIISGDGQIFWVNDMLALLCDESGTPECIQGFIIDITRRKKAEEELLERQAHLDSILDSVQDVIWSVTPDTFDLLYINPAAQRLYASCSDDNAADQPINSIGQKELLLENFDTLLSRGSFEAEYCVTLPDGEKRWLQRRAHFARDAHGLVARIDGIDTDITHRKQAEDTLRYISLHDGLTDLFNRFYFEKELQQIDMEEATTAGLIVCDVDGLKVINDQFGHEAGDRLLISCAGILKDCFQNSNEIVSRIGGDEFTILIRDCTNESLESSVARLRKAIAQHNKSNANDPISISIGQAIKLPDETNMSEVFRKADNMMYVEKFSSRWAKLKVP